MDESTFPEKEVLYSEYCSKCKYRDVEESEEPCNECLEYCSNWNSHKPLLFEEEN
jgi:hypothetical protein